MNAEQARMARAALKMGVREIADMAGVTPNTISRFENGSDPKQSTVEALRNVYQSLGVQFLQDGDTSNGTGAVLVRKGD